MLVRSKLLGRVCDCTSSLAAVCIGCAVIKGKEAVLRRGKTKLAHSQGASFKYPSLLKVCAKSQYIVYAYSPLAS